MTKKAKSMSWLLLLLSVALSQLPARGEPTSLQNLNQSVADTIRDVGYSADTSPATRKASKTVTADPASLSGKYMAFGYTTATISTRYWVDIKVSADNVVTITNLLDKGGTVTGTFNPATGIVSVKPQVIFTDNPYGDFYCYAADIEKKFYFSDRDLEFTLAPDGSLNIGNWGAFVTSGPHAGSAMIRYKEILYPAKATMTDYSITKDTVRSYPVVVIRENDNKLLIKNFYNYGADVVLTIDSTGAVNAPRTQLAIGTTSTGSAANFYNYAVTNYVSPTSMSLKTTGVPGQWTDKNITFSMWALSSSTSVSAIYELMEKSVIEMPEAFVPFSSALTLQGAGTAENPYLVETAADLQNLSSAVNYAGKYTVSKKAFAGKHFRQTADIDMSSCPNFEPIGYATASTFCGIYDGGGHTIANLHVDRRANAYAGLFGIVGAGGEIRDLTLIKPYIYSEGNYVGTVAADFQGLGYNLHVTDGNIAMANSYAGGIFGRMTGRTHDVSYSGTLKANNTMGGIAGQVNGALYNAVSYADITIAKSAAICGGIAGTMAGADTATIRNLHFDGSILDKYGSTTIGGLTGYFQNATMHSGWFSGRIYSKSISTNTTAIGGITGLLAGAQLKDCLNTGWVESPDAAIFGGLVGKHNKRVGSGTDDPRVENSLVNGMLICANSKTDYLYVGEKLETLTLSGLVYNTQLIPECDPATGLSIASLTGGDAPASLTSDNWVIRNGRYPVLKAFADTDDGILAAAPFFLDANDHRGNVKKDIRLTTDDGIEWFLVRNGAYAKTGHGLTISDNYARLSATTLCSDTLVAFKGTQRFKIAFLKIQPKEYDGEGTADDPYLIKTYQDIFRLRNAVDYQGMRYTGVHFRMANDIDFSGVEEFIGFSSQGVDNAFNGTFDGAGHRIKNWRIDRNKLVDGQPTVSGSSLLMAGFFLYTGPQAVIRNVIMDESCFIQAGSHVASLVSQNAGTVEGCANFANVRGLFTETGGLVAANAQSGVVRDCYNGGLVECGRTIAGGIVGANLGTVYGCQNDGMVINDSISSLSPAYNVMGSTGGIVGYNYGTVTECLASGEVRGPGSVGALIGGNRDTGIVTNSLVTAILHDALDFSNHGALMGTQANITDTVSNLYYDAQLSASTAAQHSSMPGIEGLHTATLVSGTLPAGLNPEIWSAAKGRYPVLRKFADLPSAMFNASCYLLLDTAGARTDSRFYMRRPSAIVKQENTTVAAGNLSISGNTLAIPDGARQLSDTLVFFRSGLTRHIPLFVPGAILAEGNGSAANPYLIKTPSDWNSVAAIAADNKLTFQDEHFRVAADLDFSSTPFSPICTDGVTRFQATLDGDGHTINNVTLQAPSSSAGNNMGLIGVLGEYGSIRNLTLGANSVIEGYTNVGGMAGQNAGLILNCRNRASIKATNTYSGGMAGYIITGGRFVDCENFGNVYVVSGQAGGIAGGNGSDIGGLALNCRNHGDIYSETRSAGGIIGSGRVDVKGCFNDGTVKAVNIYAGGIVGYFTYDLTIDSCLNEGAVTSDAGAAGGIVGFMFSSGKISRCVNKGSVYSAKTWAGGIIGNTYRDNTYVTDCDNYGDISTATTHAGGIVGNLVLGTDSLNMNYLQRVRNYGNVTAGTNYAGGIVGEAKAFTRLYNVRNYGDVKGNIYVGGVAGCMLGMADTVLNTGNVTAEKYTVGGLVGTTSSASTVTAAIHNGLNMGQVKSNGTTATTAYNVGGILGGGNIKLYNCVNTADVAGYKSVGGLVGLSIKGVNSTLSGLFYGTCIYNSLNLGAVTCLAEANAATCGHITGSSTTALSYVIYENNYYDAQHCGTAAFPADTTGTPLPTAAISASMLGDAYVQPVQGAYPVLKVFADQAEGRLASAAIAIKEQYTRHNVKESCSLYAPDDVEWVADGFTIQGGKLSWSNLTLGSSYPVEARIGNLSRRFTLTVDSATGILTLSGDNELPVSTEWYSIAGLRLASPQKGTTAVRVDRYASGKVVSRTVIVP